MPVRIKHGDQAFAPCPKRADPISERIGRPGEAA